MLVSLAPLVRKEITLAAGFVTDLASSIAQPVRSILDRFLSPVGHPITTFSDSLAFTGPSRARSALLSAINDGTLATQITITWQIEETAKLLIGRASAARSLLSKTRSR
jgi:hypothetical protein